MDGQQEQIFVSSLTGEAEVDVDAFITDARKLAAERGLAEGDIRFEVQKTFPVDGAILILLGFASKVAYDLWKEFILPELKERYRVGQQRTSH